jgi:hypothetical protein
MLTQSPVSDCGEASLIHFITQFYLVGAMLIVV